MNISQYNSYLNNIKKEINTQTKILNNNGIENTTENLFNKLKHDNIKQEIKISNKGIEAVLNKYQTYQTTLDSIQELMEKYKNKTIQKQNDTLNTESRKHINLELTEITKQIEFYLNKEVGDLKLFDKETFMLIGDNIKIRRTFDRDFIKIDNKEVSDILKSLTSEEYTDINKIEEIQDFFQEKQTIIGSMQKAMESTKKLNDNIDLNNNINYMKLSKVEEVIGELNNLSLTYEAMSKAIAKISALSLVNYI